MRFDDLKQYMDRLTEEYIPGNAVTVYHKGNKVFSYASGYADLESKTPMTGKELINIYSCSKVTTVVAACQLLERGLILLNDPLYAYIPEFEEMMVNTPDKGRIKAKEPIRIRHLFDMTAGFNYSFKSPAFDRAYEKTGGSMDTLEVVKCLAEQPLEFEPGTRWHYSLCHDVLAGLVQAVSGMKFRDYVKENIFDPLDMTESFYHRTPEIKERMASMYTLVQSGSEGVNEIEAQRRGLSSTRGVRKNAGKAIGSHEQGPEYDSGGAGIVSSVPDYAKLAAALAGGGRGVNGERILSARTVELIKRDRLTDVTRPSFDWEHLQGYGYGLGVRTLIDPARAGSLSPVGEFGWGGAAGALLIADTRNDLAVFYAHHMLNSGEKSYMARIINTVYAGL